MANMWREPDPLDMSKRAGGQQSKSGKIRVLYKAGYRQADIARHLGIRDQFVSNVVRGMKDKSIQGKAASPEVTYPDDAKEDEGDEAPRVLRVTMGPQGRIVVPVAFRQAMGVDEGSVVVLEREGEIVRMMSEDAAVRAVQAMVRRYVPKDVSLVDALLAERRREAEGEP